MAASYYIKGVGNWMKVLGEPVPNYSKDGFEWTFDVTPDDEGIDILRNVGIDGRLKNKGDDRGDFIQFKQKAHRKNGDPNRPITIVDARNRPWPQDVKIGNGSKIEVKFNVVEYSGVAPGVYPQAIRILEHVPYERQEFAPLPEDNEFVKAADAGPAANAAKQGKIKDFDLDDDFPE